MGQTQAEEGLGDQLFAEPSSESISCADIERAGKEMVGCLGSKARCPYSQNQFVSEITGRIIGAGSEVIVRPFCSFYSYGSLSENAKKYIHKSAIFVSTVCGEASHCHAFYLIKVSAVYP